MGAVELIALGLTLSLPIAAAGLAAGLLADRLTGEPRVREPVWIAAMLAPLAPLAGVLVAVALPDPLLVPAFLPDLATDRVETVFAPTGDRGQAFQIPEWTFLAGAFLVLAGLAAAARTAGLAVRVLRIRKLRDKAAAGEADLAEAVARVARAMGVKPPQVLTANDLGQPLLVGGVRPTLLLPSAWSRDIASGHDEAVLAHEIAHLKRADHLTIWLDEAILVVLAVNPLMGAIRSRLAAVREEACDALALDRREPDERHAYAQTYLRALAAPRMGAPALTFTGSNRRLAMRRLKHILNPAPRPDGRRRAGVAACLATLIACAGGVAFAAASQDAGGLAPALPDSPEALEAMLRERLGDEAYEARRERLQNADGAQFQRICASGDAGDDGFCAGVLYGTASREQARTEPRFCAPDTSDVAFVDVAKTEIARQVVAAGDTPRMVAERALTAAYPCPRSVADARAPPGVGTPDTFLQRPTGEQLARAAPAAAVAAGVDGRVVMQCRAVAPSGRLEDCRVTDEQPSGYGFGEATLSLAGAFRMRMEDANGRPLASAQVSVPILWNLPESPSPRLQPAGPTPFAPNLVNGALLPIPAGYGRVEITADEVVRGDDGHWNYRTPGTAPLTRFRVDGELQPAGFDIRSIPADAIERILVDTRADAIEVTLEG